jgi:hypothetical protein
LPTRRRSTISAKSIETVVENGTEVFIPPNKLKKSRKNARKPPHILARHDLLDILGNRYGRRSPIVTSQLLVDQWHALIGDPLAPTPSSTAWSITPTGSISTARVCGETRPQGQSPWRCGHAAALGQRELRCPHPTAGAAENNPFEPAIQD